MLHADENGIWKTDENGVIFGIRWDEVRSVVGCRVDTKPRVVTLVEIGFENGDGVEAGEDEAGFDRIAGALDSRLPGMMPGWREVLAGRTPDDPPLAVWQRVG